MDTAVRLPLLFVLFILVFLRRCVYLFRWLFVLYRIQYLGVPSRHEDASCPRVLKLSCLESELRDISENLAVSTAIARDS
jgi:hypothetical protein